MRETLPHDGAVAKTVSDQRSIQEIASEMNRWLDTDSSGHDMAHAWRVFDLGVRLAKAEGADTQIVGAAALTHDVHRIMGEAGEFVHPEKSIPHVREILNATSFPTEKIPDVLHCVAVHDEYEYKEKTRPAETIEAKVLRDADNLDAMGAVGIARCFAFNGIVGNPLWDPDGERPSGIGHFYEKLLKLEDEMNTETARSLANERHDFLQTFVQRFEQEWKGER